MDRARAEYQAAIEQQVTAEQLGQIRAAVRDGRITNDYAARWTAQVLAEHRRALAEIRAHSNAQVVDKVTQAVQTALSGDGGGGSRDDYAGLFPPSAPLGPPLGDEELASTSLIYDGADQGKPNRTPRTVPGFPALMPYAWAPLSDEELHRALFGDHQF